MTVICKFMPYNFWRIVNDTRILPKLRNVFRQALSVQLVKSTGVLVLQLRTQRASKQLIQPEFTMDEETQP